MQVHRQDFGAIKRATPTPQGGLKLDAWITRTGVLTYKREDGTITRELRHPDEVFKAESLATFQHAPLTDLHPRGRVDATNYGALSRGHLTNEVQKAEDGKHVAASVLVQDAEMIAMIDRGERKELSCGYACDLDETPGEYEGERYDAVQKNIVGNHVAALPVGAGRAGPTAALRVDRVDGLCVSGQQDRRDSNMATVRIDGLDLEVGSAAHFAALDKQRDAMVKAEKDRADALSAKVEAQLAELKAAKDRADAAEVDAKVAKLPGLVEKIAKAKFKADEKDAEAIADVIGAAFKLDGKVGLGAIKKYLDSMHAAADAFMKIAPDEEGDDEEDDEPKKGNPFAKDKKKDSRDDSDDSFSARARAEGRGNGDEKPIARRNYQDAHSGMVSRIRGMSEVKTG